MMSLIVSLAFAAIVIVSSTYRRSLEMGGEPIYAIVAESALWFFFFISFVAVWQFYCGEWKKLSPHSIPQAAFQRLIFPMATVLLIIHPHHFISNGSPWFLALSTALLIVSLADFDSSIKLAVGKAFSNLNATNKRVLYSNYPPVSRADIFPMDLIVNLATALMIAKKFF